MLFAVHYKDSSNVQAYFDRNDMTLETISNYKDHIIYNARLSKEVIINILVECCKERWAIPYRICDNIHMLEGKVKASYHDAFNLATRNFLSQIAPEVLEELMNNE